MWSFTHDLNLSRNEEACFVLEQKSRSNCDRTEVKIAWQNPVMDANSYENQTPLRFNVKQLTAITQCLLQ